MEANVNKIFSSPNLYDFNGNKIEATGTISLRWKLYPDGTKLHDEVVFFVSTNDDIDMIFGLEYIVQKRLLGSNRAKMLPLTEHNKETLCK